MYDNEQEATVALMSVNLGDAVQHFALSSVLSPYNMVVSKLHASFINPVLVDSFRTNLLCDWWQNCDARKGD